MLIRPAALEQLKAVTFQENEGVRIEAIYVGSCSLYADHHLRIDQRSFEDDVFLIEGIPVFVSKESQKYLHQRVSLDYNSSLGYRLYSDNEIYKYNLQLKH